MPAVPQQIVDLPDCQENWEWVQKYLSPAAVTTMPTNGLFDGMEVTYAADAANGVYWHFKRVSGVWVFIGGSPLHSQIVTDETFGAVGFVDATTVGPSITLPLAGNYEYDHSCSEYSAGQTTSVTFQSGLLVGGVFANQDAAGACTVVLGNAVTMGKCGILVSQPASTVVKLQYSLGGSGGTPHCRWRELRITPTKLT